MSESENTILKRQIEELRAENARLKQEIQCHEVKQAMEKLQVALRPRFVRLGDLVCNPGLKHIALQIFKGLDPKSHGNCRLVSKEWKDCIDNSKWWWQQQIACMLSIYQLQLKYCEIDRDWRPVDRNKASLEDFNEALKYVSKEESLDNLQLFTMFMRDYFQKESKFNLTDPEWYIFRTSNLPAPLYYAANDNRLDILQICARSPMKNMDVDTFYQIDSGSTSTILFSACIKNQFEVVEFYMNLKGHNRVDFNKTSFIRSLHKDPVSLFHEACKSNKVEVVKLFLDRAEELKIDLNVRDRSGITPLMRVASKDVMKLLLSDDRIDATVIDAEGCNVLHHICKNTRGNGNLDLKPYMGEFKEITEEQITDTIVLLLQSPKIPYTRDIISGFTPLHHACYTQHQNEQRIEAMLKVLLEKSIDVNEVDFDGDTAVHIAFGLAFGFGTRAEILFEKPLYFTTLPPTVNVFLKFAKRMGINIEATNNDGKTPLHKLCENIQGLVGKEKYIDNFLRLVKTEYGIVFNLKATNNAGKTPFEMLCFDFEGFE